MEERCEFCRFCHKLKHHFELGYGFHEGYCCDMLLKLPEEDSKIESEGWIQEVTLDSICEMFTRKK